MLGVDGQRPLGAKGAGPTDAVARVPLGVLRRAGLRGLEAEFSCQGFGGKEGSDLILYLLNQ